MNMRRKKKKAQKVSPDDSKKSLKFSFLRPGPLLITSFVLAVTIVTVALAFSIPEKRIQVQEQKPDRYSLEYLVKLSDAELAKYDIAEFNLAASRGLPGAENINIPQALEQIDLLAGWVKLETERNFYRFVRDPKEYENSEARYRMGMLITVVCQDFGVKYSDRQKGPEGDYTKPEDYFLYGVLSDRRDGTCGSMSTLYTAIGRRLGYPMKMVTTKGHIFCRWDDPHGERVNFEGTNGPLAHTDDHYKEWPNKWDDLDYQNHCFLKSHSHRQDLADCLKSRGDSLIDLHRKEEALQAYRLALELWPDNPSYHVALYCAENGTIGMPIPTYEPLHHFFYEPPKRKRPHDDPVPLNAYVKKPESPPNQPPVNNYPVHPMDPMNPNKTKNKDGRR